jgi:membrane peptidoglycan carboxypeptidase
MGYQVGVTPIQLTAAFNVIASGGLMLEPRMVRAVTRKGRRQEAAPKVLRRVVSAETAAAVTAMLEGVVERGTGKPAGLTRYQVAGKTGTASKLINGRYSKTDYNVSFGGFVPSRHPEFTILVVVDTPRQGPVYGGAVAAPIFRRIAEAALNLSGVVPSFDSVPPIVVAADRPAPPAPPRRASFEPAVIKTAGAEGMPDLRGLSLRDATRVTTALGLTMSAHGDGVVVQQSPAPGAAVVAGARGVMHLRRIPVTPVPPGEGRR